ncbi:MAG: transketolase, partial [Candidatus Omnitrophica bacterium]|nr:transketolase [Candidatus Omnitrophota bacterium]
VCYHKADVKIVIIGGGVSYGALGISHHSTEDIAIMRALPEMVVLCPCDCVEAEGATVAMIEHKGPVYYRCGYKGEKDIHPGPIDFKIGKAIEVEKGGDAAIIFTGPIGYNVVIASELLRKQGIACRLVSMHTIKPIDKQAVLSAAGETGAVITVEEHNIDGGLGSAVAEVLADNAAGVKFRRIALPDVLVGAVGSQEWLRSKYGMSPEGIAETVQGLLKDKK